MEPLLRAAAMYLFLLVVFRFTGRRMMNQMTSFDFVLLLVLGESAQQALVGRDYSLTTAFVVITTLLLLDIGLALLKDRSHKLARWLDGVPVLLMYDGQLQRAALRHERMDEGDLLSAARSQHGLHRLDQIRHAILEKDGQISIIPRQPEKTP